MNIHVRWACAFTALLLAASMTACGNKNTTPDATDRDEPSVSAPVPDVSDTASPSDTTHGDVIGVNPEEDAYCIARKMLIDDGNSTTAQLVKIPLSLIYWSTPKSVAGYSGEGTIDLFDGASADIGCLVIVDYEDGMRLVMDNACYDYEWKDDRSTSDIEVWRVYSGNEITKQPDADVLDGYLMFGVDNYTPPPERATRAKSLGRVMGIGMDVDGDEVQVSLNSVYMSRAVLEERFGAAYDKERDAEEMSAAARQTVVRNYDFLVEMLRLWGYTVEGSVFGTPDDLATYLEDRDAQYTETGYVYISIGATDGDYDTAPVRCYLSTDCEHILLVTGGTDMTVSSVWWAD